MGSAKSATFRAQTVSSALAEELRERILNMDIPEGKPLRQDVLADTFGVSRIPVREALLQLEGEGLVTQTAHKGYTVTPLSIEDIRELFDLRALIEVDLLNRSIPKLADSDLSAARRVLETFDELLRRGSQEQKWGKLNWELHAALCRPADRPRTMRMLQNLHRNADRYLRRQLQLTDRTSDRARAEHNKLVTLCEARDAVEATRLLKEHILAARDDLIESLVVQHPARDSTRAT